MTEVEQIVEAINNQGQFGTTDFVTMAIAACSIFVAVASVIIASNQKNISKRAERLSIHTELFDILHYLKNYNGACDDKSDEYYKRLQKLKAVSESAYTKEAGSFIDELLTEMHKMPTRYAAHIEGVDEIDVKVLEKYGLNPKIAGLHSEEYIKLKKYFKSTTFEKFESLFPV